MSRDQAPATAHWGMWVGGALAGMGDGLDERRVDTGSVSVAAAGRHRADPTGTDAFDRHRVAPNRFAKGRSTSRSGRIPNQLGRAPARATFNEAAAMTDRQYARKRPEPKLAWHVINFHTRGLNTWKALCGRTVVDPTVDVLPAGPSCESCLRIQRRQDDPAP